MIVAQIKTLKNKLIKYFQQSMKHLHQDDIEIVKNIQNEVWKFLESMRGRIKEDGYGVVLFLLYLQQQDIFENFKLLYAFENDTIKEQLNSFFKHAVFNEVKLDELFFEFSPTINEIPDKHLSEFIYNLRSIEHGVYSKLFPYIFDGILTQASEKSGKRNGVGMLPSEINAFAAGLVKVQKNALVYNPFAGVGSLGVALGANVNYIAEEWNRRTWAIGKLRLLAHGLDAYNFNNQDSIYDWNRQEGFDLIISNPPFRAKLSHMEESLPEVRTYEQFLLKQGIRCLKPDGKLVALLPKGILFRRGYDQKIREDIIESGALESVISLPSGLLYNTSIPLAIIVIDKGRNISKPVKFLNGETFFKKGGGRIKTLDTKALLSEYFESRDSNFIKEIPVEELRKNDFSLSVERFFIEKIDGRELKEFVETIRGGKADKTEEGFLVQIRNLSNSKFETHLNIEKLEKKELPPKSSLRKIEESCLLISLVGNSLRPTYFKYEKTPIFIQNSIQALRVKENLVDIQFLIFELKADYALKQLEGLRRGTAIQSISKNDLLSIVIKIIPLEEQMAKVRGIIEISERIEALEKERNERAHGKSEADFNRFASLKHTLGAPRQNILSASKLLHNFFKRNASNEFDDLNSRFEKRYNIEGGILNVLGGIRKDINYISEVLENSEKGLDFDKHDLSTFTIREFKTQLLGLIKQLKNNYKFRVEHDFLLPEVEDNFWKQGIESNETLLRILIENIFTNADRYGFSDTNKNFEVRVEFQIADDNKLLLKIENNGNPFPENFTKQNFITEFSKGSNSKGKGIGGHNIHLIAQRFNSPDWELILNKTAPFPVSFEFYLPIKTI